MLWWIRDPAVPACPCKHSVTLGLPTRLSFFSLADQSARAGALERLSCALTPRPFLLHVSATAATFPLPYTIQAPVGGKPFVKMNLLLSDDYLLQDYPENITNTIRSGHATCLRFNRRGDYLASGRVDGTVVIWDLDTMGVARKLRGHSKSISSLSWSRCGRYLLSACQGWKAILWDLQDGKPYRQVRFKAPVYIAELHPWNQ